MGKTESTAKKRTSSLLVVLGGEQSAPVPIPEAAKKKAGVPQTDTFAEVLAAAGLGMTSVFFPFLRPVTAAVFYFAAKKIASAGGAAKDRSVGRSEAAPWLEVRTLEEVADGQWRFPPGHPFPNQVYKQHPLAPYRPEKEWHFIPIDDFDSLLFKEREAELLRLLVVLGATEVEIRKNKQYESAVKGHVEAKAAGFSGAADASGQKSDREEDVRKFVLAGRPWIPGSSIETAQFGWLGFEPSWESLVFARLEGGCTSAALELTTRTSFSFASRIQLSKGLLESLGELGASLEAEVKRSSDYSVHVTFLGRQETTDAR